jgi:hypothetical protein
MKYRWLWSILIVVLIVFFAGCPITPVDDPIEDGNETEENNPGSDDNGGGSSSPPQTTIYTAGYYNDGTNDIACYWVDGVKKDLEIPADAGDSRAHAVYVYNGDVYTAGYYTDASSNDVACYWKNETISKEFSGGAGQANAIWVDAGVVYVAGYYRNASNEETLWYWDGTTEHTLEGAVDNLNADVTDMSVKNGNVYVSGYYDPADVTIDRVATYWKNGTKITTDLYSDDSRALGIYVPDTEDAVYVSGRYNNGVTIVSGYWKDGASELTPLYTTGLSFAYGIDVEGTPVYTCGFYRDGTDMACYWEGTDKTDLDNGRALDIAVDSDSIYIAGYYYDGFKKIACYWKDGVKTELYDSEQLNVHAEALSVFIYTE